MLPEKHEFQNLYFKVEYKQILHLKEILLEKMVRYLNIFYVTQKYED